MLQYTGNTESMRASQSNNGWCSSTHLDLLIRQIYRDRECAGKREGSSGVFVNRNQTSF